MAPRFFKLISDNRALRFRAELESQVREIRHLAGRVEDRFHVVVKREDGGVGEVAQAGEECGERGGEGVLKGLSQGSWRRLPVEGGEEGGRLAEEVLVLAVGF